MATVVIAAASPSLRRVLGAVLCRAGHDVLTARDGVEAVQAAVVHRPVVAVLAASLPRLSGHAAARLLETGWRGAASAVILLGPAGGPAAGSTERDRAVRSGAADYLDRDVTPAQLAAAVAALAAGREHPDLAAPPGVEVTDEDVLAAACDLLDRRLHDAALAEAAAGLAVGATDLDAAAAALFDLLHGAVGYDAAALAVADGHGTTVRLARRGPVGEPFLAELAGRAAAAAGAPAPDGRDPGGRAVAGPPADLRLLIDRAFDDDGGSLEPDELAAIGTLACLRLPPVGAPAAVAAPAAAVALAVEAPAGFAESAQAALHALAAPAARLLGAIAGPTGSAAVAAPPPPRASG